MFNDDISGHLPLKIDVNPAVTFSFFFFLFLMSVVAVVLHLRSPPPDQLCDRTLKRS